jgi:anti-sigma factor RsiW
VNCSDTRNLSHAYADGELDLVRSLEVEQHLENCTACAGVHRDLQALRAALHSGSLAFKPPAELRGRIRSAVRQASGARRTFQVRRWHWAAAAASLACVALLGWMFVHLWSAHVAEEALTKEIASSHIRALLDSHLVVVPSSDRHKVKPWFNDKLGFSPPVKDLARPDGFTLLGGRRDYVGNRAVATLVYQRREHMIDLYVWPEEGASDSTEAVQTYQGYNLIHWTKDRMTFWAVSDLNSAELGEFVRAFQK